MYSSTYLVALLVPLASQVLGVPSSPLSPDDFTNHATRTLAKRDNGLYCGAVSFAPDGTQYKKVSGQWTIPELSLRDGQDNSQRPNVPIWVGIDAYNCGTLLQSGTTSFINEDGSHTTDFWVEFFPDGAVFQNFPSNVGDQVEVVLTADSDTTGTAILINHTQGQNKTVSTTAPAGSKLCFTNAEWVIEYSGTMAGFSTIDMATGGRTSADAEFNSDSGTTTGTIVRGDTEYCNGGPVAGGHVSITPN